jgi:fructan beta-fructosidase
MMLQEDDINYSLVENCSIFHFGSISMTHDTAAAATIKAASTAKNKGAVISFDPNLRIPLWSSLEHAKSMIRKGLTYADVIKISEEELEFISGTADLAQGSEYIRDNYGVSIILVTLAEKGCFVRYGDVQFSVPGFEVVAVDTTGAGDAFLGGFLYRLLEKGCKTEDLSEADLYGMARFANAAGALATTRKGAIPAMPSLAEIGELLQP